MTSSATPTDPTDTAAWTALRELARAQADVTIRAMVEADRGRPQALTHTAAGVHFDASRQRVTGEIVTALLALADQRGVLERRDEMFAGAHINVFEDRAVLHTALRRPANEPLTVDGQDVTGEVHEVLDRMSVFADAVRSGEWLGATGKRITAVVNIGIGGSDLGPAMAYLATRHYSERSITFRFVSNVDPTDMSEAIRDLDPGTTLFIVASKTFGTLETLTNAHAARSWLVASLGDDAVSRHFVAVSTNAVDVAAFGIDTANMFGFWDWVGGRYSMDSSIGLSTMISIGSAGFAEMLAGFHAMDEHFLTAVPTENVPLLMGLIAVWNRNFLNVETTAVLPYSEYMSRFPAYLQQLTMESNGKSVRLDGVRVDYQTGAIFWGEPGTNGQHSFYQLLHQGTSTVSADIIVVARSDNPLTDQQDMLVANALAQASVLSMGRTAAEVAADGTAPGLVEAKVMPGNRPVSVITVESLTPFALGSLVALYEHSVFVQGAVWGIDSFDQWGVELGKKVAMGILGDLRNATSDDPKLDAPTKASIDLYLALRA